MHRAGALEARMHGRGWKTDRTVERVRAAASCAAVMAAATFKAMRAVFGGSFRGLAALR